MGTMYAATIRPAETRTVDLTGNSLDEIHAAAEVHCPEGFELSAAPVRMIKGSTALAATATYQRVDGVREIEADDRAALAAMVPDGWIMLAMRSTQ